MQAAREAVRAEAHCELDAQVEAVHKAEQAAVSAQQEKEEAVLYAEEYEQLYIALNRHDAAFRTLHRGKGPKSVNEMSEEHRWAYERRLHILRWYPTLSAKKRKEMGHEQ
eukprot:3052411-Pleurochrysis_carterae.AAC.1